MINKVILIGNLGADPDVRATQDGREIASLTLATSEQWKDKSTGERKEKTEWHKVVIFSEGLVNLCKKYTNKGDKIYVEGKLQTRKWEDKQGVERYTTEIVLQGFDATMKILSSKGEGNRNPPQDKAPANDLLDDEIPF